MTTGLVLVAAILVLGGVIATVGDRIGTRVGKARLSLFRMRPRQTATLISILTGIVISASTFALLFAVNDQLRKGVFEYEKIQKDLVDARTEQSKLTGQKQRIQQQLQTARRQQATAQRRLQRINQSLQTAVQKQSQTEQALGSTQAQLQQVQGRFQQAQAVLSTVSQQAAALQAEIQQLQTDQKTLIKQRDQVREQISERDQEIANRNQEIASREKQLQDLESQRTYLAKEIDTLEQDFQALREGNVALVRNQTLTSALVRVVSPSAVRQTIDSVLREANRQAVQRVLPGANGVESQVIQITNAEVEQISQQIRDGKDYFIRVASSANYVVGEPCVLSGEDCIKVDATAVLNQILFHQGDVVATTAINPTIMDDKTLAERIKLLGAAAQFRLRQAGVQADIIPIADNSKDKIISFITKVRQYGQPLDIQVVAARDVYVSEAQLELAATQNGQIVFNTSG